MLRHTERSEMVPRLNSDSASLDRPGLMVWVAVIGFVLGTIFCSFGPSSNDEVLKERKTMFNASDNSTIPAASPNPNIHGTRFEVATFSMG